METNWARIRHAAKRGIEQLTGFRLYRQLPHGVDLLLDITRLRDPVRVIVDVGANEGQSASRFREDFPDARIYCLEPVAATFNQLRHNVDGLGCRCFQLAAGSRKESRDIFVGDNSLISSLHDTGSCARKERVAVTTLDDWTSEEGIRSIDILKVDTEGHDLEVLAGASNLLNQGAIRAVVIEVGFDPSKPFVVLEDVVHTLRHHGFGIVGFYHQTADWSGKRNLLFADVLFVKDG